MLLVAEYDKARKFMPALHSARASGYEPFPHLVVWEAYVELYELARAYNFSPELLGHGGHAGRQFGGCSACRNLGWHVPP